MFNWKWYYNLPSLLLWVVLLGAIIFIKENHNRRVLLIFIPILIVHLILYGLLKLLNAPSSAGVQMGTLITSYTIGLAVLWLIAYKLKQFRTIVRFFVAFGTMMVISLLGILSIYSDFQSETFLIITLFFFMTIVMLLSFAVSGKLCGKKYRPIVFMLWLCLWLQLCSVIAMTGFAGIGMVIMQSVPSKEAFIQIPIAGLFFGLFLYVVNLPYFILGFVNPFFRERFYACLNLKSMHAIKDSDSDQSDERR